MLPLVTFSIAFGLAATHISADLRGPLLLFFRAVSEAMQTLVRWLVKLAPVGVFCLILPLAAHIGPSAVGEFGYYIVVLSALLCALILALYVYRSRVWPGFPPAVRRGGVSGSEHRVQLPLLACLVASVDRGR